MSASEKSHDDSEFVEHIEKTEILHSNLSHQILTWSEANSKARELFFQGRRSTVLYNENFNKFDFYF